jgi:hypothetical protein
MSIPMGVITLYSTGFKVSEMRHFVRGPFVDPLRYLGEEVDPHPLDQMLRG